MPIIPQYSILKKKIKRTSCKKTAVSWQPPITVATCVKFAAGSHWRVTLPELFPACSWAWPGHQHWANPASCGLAKTELDCQPRLCLPPCSPDASVRPALWSEAFFFFCNFTYLYLFLAVLSLCCCTQAFPSSGKRGLLSSCGGWASHCSGFSCCWARPRGTRAQLLWHMGLVAGWHVESSWTRGRTHVPCIGRRILNHWTTWGAQGSYYCSLSCSQASLPGDHYTSYSILVCAFRRLELTLYLQMCAVWVYNFLLIFCWVAVISLRVLGTLDKLPNLCASVSSDVNGK